MTDNGKDQIQMRHTQAYNGSVSESLRDSPRPTSIQSDTRDLARWGKKRQMKRNFGMLSTISLTCTLMITLEGMLAAFAGGLTNGGAAGLVYAFLFAWVGNMLQALVMSELASIMPLAGGQYNCLMIQGLLVLNYPNTYIYQNRHGTLSLYAVVVCSALVNTLLIRTLPHIESLIFVIRIVGFVVVLVPLIYFSEKNSAEFVFTEFFSGGAWSSMALSWFAGLSPTLPVFLGLNAASHIAEQIRNASTIVPKSIIVSVAINGAMGLAMVLAVLFCIEDVETVLASPTKVPFIQFFQDSTQSFGGTTAMASVAVAAFLFAAVGALATASRMTWGFSRERAMPFSQILSTIEPRTRSPLFSIGLSAVITFILGLINVGSDTAFYALTSLVVAGFYTTFNICAGVLLYRKLKRNDLVNGPFQLGKWSYPVITGAMLYTTIGLIFSFLPSAVDSDLKTMNWAVVGFAGSIAFAVLFWFAHGRKVYDGPIMEVTMDYNGNLRYSRM